MDSSHIFEHYLWLESSCIFNNDILLSSLHNNGLSSATCMDIWPKGSEIVRLAWRRRVKQQTVGNNICIDVLWRF